MTESEENNQAVGIVDGLNGWDTIPGIMVVVTAVGGFIAFLSWLASQPLPPR